MPVTTVVRRILGVTGLVVDGFAFEEDGLIVAVRPRWRRPRCGECGKRAPGYDERPARRWRHLGLGELRVWLEYAPRRVDCPRCGGVRTEPVPWAPHQSRFTWDFEELVAYLAQVSDRTKVTELMGISWRTVGAIVERVVARRLDPSRLEGLRRIGIDEFSYRKYHRYLTTVVDHDRGRVVWAAPGRSAETLGAFFDALGEERAAAIETVTIDMSEGYRKAVEERAPQAKIVYDRFHVQRLASDAVDQVRRAQVRDLGVGTEEGQGIKGTRYALLKNPWDLTRKEKQKLSELQRNNARLYRAYLLKETLAQALDYRQPGHARRALEDWLAWASRSKLAPFVKVARTIREHLDGVVAYLKERLTNGIVEGFNNKLRMIARRAFGFHSPEPLIAMLYLCCGGIQLNPPLPRPT
ncbi:MAG: ISL3 family transposase [Gemmatimonadota bacterium]